MLQIFRTKSKVHISTWDQHSLIMFEMTPAIEGVTGSPKDGEIRYCKEKKCIISFSPEEALRCAWHLSKLSNGIDVPYNKVADTSKIQGREDGEVKKFNIVKSTTAAGGAMISMTSGDKKVSIVLSYPDLYVIQKYMENKALGYMQ